MGLKPIFSKSFPANNLLDISLVYDDDPNRPFYRPAYFIFLSMTQGVIAENGQRTFDKNSRITIKTDSVKIFAFSNAIKAFVNGQGTTIGQFQIFADSGKSHYATEMGNAGVIKMAFVSEFDQQMKNSNTVKKNIAISMKQGNNKPIGVFYSLAEALAIATIFDFMANKCLELDFNSRNVNIGSVQPQPPQAQPQSQPQPQPPNNSATPMPDEYSSIPDEPFNIESPF